MRLTDAAAARPFAAAVDKGLAWTFAIFDPQTTSTLVLYILFFSEPELALNVKQTYLPARLTIPDVKNTKNEIAHIKDMYFSDWGF